MQHPSQETRDRKRHIARNASVVQCGVRTRQHATERSLGIAVRRSSPPSQLLLLLLLLTQMPIHNLSLTALLQQTQTRRSHSAPSCFHRKEREWHHSNNSSNSSSIAIRVTEGKTLPKQFTLYVLSGKKLHSHCSRRSYC